MLLTCLESVDSIRNSARSPSDDGRCFGHGAHRCSNAVFDNGALSDLGICTQRLQNPLIQDYTLNLIRVPIII